MEEKKKKKEEVNESLQLTLDKDINSQNGTHTYLLILLKLPAVGRYGVYQTVFNDGLRNLLPDQITKNLR